MATVRDLDGGRLGRLLAEEIEGFGGEVHVAEETGSTNDDVRAAAARGAPAGTIVVADAQRRGRGRAGRAWYSPPGRNLHLSLLLRPGWEAARAGAFALVVGLVVAREVDARLPSPRARVKWPNDVLCGGRKLGGVLLEASVARGRVAALTVGIGLDVAARSFPEELAASATSLAIEGAVDLDRTRLAAALVAGTMRAAARFAEGGLAPFLPELLARDALRGARVTTEDGPGIARGIDEEGRLLVEAEGGGLRRVVAGDVSPMGPPP